MTAEQKLAEIIREAALKHLEPDPPVGSEFNSGVRAVAYDKSIIKVIMESNIVVEAKPFPIQMHMNNLAAELEKLPEGATVSNVISEITYEVNDGST